jgi:hypothetical protein
VLVQQRPALAQWAIEQRLAAQVEQVEDNVLHGIKAIR